MDEESGLLLKSRPVDNGGKIGHAAYEVLPLCEQYRINHPNDIAYCRLHSEGHKWGKGFLTLLTLPLSWIWLIARIILIPSGHIGISRNNGKPEFMPPGWHFVGSVFRSVQSVKPINSDQPIINLSQGLVTVPDGKIGIARDQGKFVLLGPGMHQWDTPTFEWHAMFELSNEMIIRLGPYTLVTVPPGEVAITEDNGELKILSQNAQTGKRSHFLNHSKWMYMGMLSTQVQIDGLPSSNLLSADRVEVNLDSTVSWHIVDAVKVGLSGGHTMKHLREIVHRAARACLSNMIAHRKISDQAMAHSVDKHSALSAAYDASKAHVESEDQSQRASQQQLLDCNNSLERIGVEVTQLAIVKMTIHHEDIRQKINDVAAIPAMTQKIREMARANADSAVMEAEGKAKARMLEAEASANSIRRIAEAQQDAGRMLGEGNSTASRLAQIAATGEALKNSSTVYFTQAGQTPNLMLQQ